LKWGTGGINIDGCRVGTESLTINGGGKKWRNNGEYTEEVRPINEQRTGRFPANLIHDGSDEVVSLFPNVKSSRAIIKGGFGAGVNTFGAGVNTFGARCIESERGFNDSGSASRFFYTSKASKGERNKGCNKLKEQMTGHGNLQNSEGFERFKTFNKNNHPTVKPVSLMKYLITLVTKKRGIVLDPFAGSGTTAVACRQIGMNFIMIEKDSNYVRIMKARKSIYPITLWEVTKSKGMIV
jgi:site-specific DNA-methyltransferase (adenine-specific)